MLYMPSFHTLVPYCTLVPCYACMPSLHTSSILSKGPYITCPLYLHIISMCAILYTKSNSCSRWLQPDRAVDPEASELDVPSDPVATGLPSEFTVTTRDQDGKMVYVRDMKVRLIRSTFALLYNVHVHDIKEVKKQH